MKQPTIQDFNELTRLYPRLKGIRERIGNIEYTSLNAESLINARLRPYEDHVLAGLKKDFTETDYLLRMSENFQLSADVLISEYGFPAGQIDHLARVQTCAILYMPFAAMLNTADNALGKEEDFAFWYDVASGYLEVFFDIFMAGEPEESWEEDRMAQHIYEEHSEDMNVEGEVKHEYAAWVWKEYDRGLVDLDPTGYLLLEGIVSRIRKEATLETPLSYIRSYQTPQFVLAGAEFAQRLYKTVYPRLNNLPKGKVG